MCVDYSHTSLVVIIALDGAGPVHVRTRPSIKRASNVELSWITKENYDSMARYNVCCALCISISGYRMSPVDSLVDGKKGEINWT